MPAYAGQKPFEVRTGNPQPDGVTFAIWSLSSGGVTLTVNGIDYPVALSPVGADRGTAAPGGQTTAGYVGSQVISGLPGGFKQWAYSASQAGSLVAGTFYTLPGRFDTFSFTMGTCEEAFETIEQDSGCAGSIRNSMWEYVETIIGNIESPYVGHLHCDDLAYIDGISVDDTNGTGHKSSGFPKTTLKEYDYALGYFSQAGLLQDATEPNLYVSYGHRAARQKCMANGWYIPQWGNHEFAGFEGTFAASHSVPGSSGNSYHKTLNGFDGAGLVVYDALFAPLEPPHPLASPADTIARLWGIDLGPIRIVGPDNITNNVSDTVTPANNVIFGSNQITDILAALDTDAPFKIFFTQHALRKLSTTGYDHWDMFSNQPVEYAQLFTDAGGIMSKTSLNGSNGTFINVFGDSHRGSVRRMQGTQGTFAEYFYDIACASMNHQDGHSNGSGVDENTIYNEMLVEYRQRGVGWDQALQPPTDGRSIDHTIRVDVDGPAQTITMNVVGRDICGGFSTRWSKKFKHGAGNSAYVGEIPDASVKVELDA